MRSADHEHLPECMYDQGGPCICIYLEYLTRQEAGDRKEKSRKEK